jgi:hypothetical protein
MTSVENPNPNPVESSISLAESRNFNLHSLGWVLKNRLCLSAGLIVTGLGNIFD